MARVHFFRPILDTRAQDFLHRPVADRPVLHRPV